MLKVDDLKSQLRVAISSTVTPAIEACIIQQSSQKNSYHEKLAKQIAKTFDDTVSEQLAELFANAIDYYIKNATIFGLIITSGGPVTQTSSLKEAPMPKLAGIIPNTLGIK